MIIQTDQIKMKLNSLSYIGKEKKNENEAKMWRIKIN